MHAALNQVIIKVKKLVFLPVKAGASMRAAVFIGMEAGVFMHYKQVDLFSSLFNREFFRTGVGDFVTVTEFDGHSLLAAG